MNFISFEFIGFFAVTFFVFSVVPKSLRLFVLLLASYAFYATWNAPLILLILFTTSVTYGLALVIHRSQSPWRRKLALTLAIAFSILLLLYYKYANFFLTQLRSVAPQLAERASSPAHLDIILPLGISFYTFEAISFLVDVYRRQIPKFDFLTYNFYIMYFPHLLSGPIIRYEHFTEQARFGMSRKLGIMWRRGLKLIVLGCLYKIVLADPMATLADPVFASPNEANAFTAWLAAIAFTGQIYFDFLGYTHIARGISNLLNIELPINFNYPYEAHNVSDFWRRWHISLSTWIRDYLYLPFGGSRVSRARGLFNLVLVMTIAGAWHGSGWNYILWGTYHGLLLIAYHGFKLVTQKRVQLPHAFAQAITFISVIFGWILFRAPDLKTATTISQKMFALGQFRHFATEAWMQNHLSQISAMIVILGFCLCGTRFHRFYHQQIAPLPFWMKTVAISAVMLIVFLMSAESSRPFIYFQF